MSNQVRLLNVESVRVNQGRQSIGGDQRVRKRYVLEGLVGSVVDFIFDWEFDWDPVEVMQDEDNRSFNIFESGLHHT